MEQEKKVENSPKEDKPEINVEKVMERLEQLESSNARLLEQSKDWKSKYYGIQQEKEKEVEAKLTEKEQWKELVEIEKNKRFELESKVKDLSNKTMQKDLQYKVASMAKDAYNVDDVITSISRTGMLEIDKESGVIQGVEEAYNKVREDKPYLFNTAKKSGMSAGNPEPMIKDKSLDEQIADDPNAMLADVLKNLV